MDTWAWLVLILIALVVGAGAAWLYTRRQRSLELSNRFGPEYDRAVRTYGSRDRAESELQGREERVRRLEIRQLSPADQSRFAEAWRAVQARFVDEPGAAVRDADLLIREVMEARGYPVGDFEQRAADVSVDHPRVVEDYRAAHRIAGRNERGEASTEDLRQAMVHYRSLFDDLLGVTESQTEVQR